jgi:hypothetical protein
MGTDQQRMIGCNPNGSDSALWRDRRSTVRRPICAAVERVALLAECDPDKAWLDHRERFDFVRRPQSAVPLWSRCHVFFVGPPWLLKLLFDPARYH